MTQEWANIDIADKFKNTDEVIQAMVEIMMDNPDSFVWQCTKLLYNALENLSYCNA